MRAAWSGSCVASHLSLVTVNDATSTDPTASAHACGPPELLGQVGGGLRGPGVVPQQGVADHGAVVGEADHAVLLPADRDRGAVIDAVGLGGRRVERVDPVPRVDLGAVGVGAPPLAHDGAGLGVDDQDLAGLRGGVDPRYQRHQRTP